MRLPTFAALLAVAIALSATAASADVDGSQFTSTAWGVRLTAPRSWQLSERSSYPNVLLWMSRRGPRGRMLFAAERLPAGDSALDYARRTATKLEAMGFRVRPPQLHSATGAYWIDVENRTAYLRQAFLVTSAIGYTLTLSAETGRARSQHLRAFDAALRSVKLVDGPPAAAVEPEAHEPGPDEPAATEPAR